MINITEAITDLSRLQTTFKHLQNLKDILEHARDAEGTIAQAQALRDEAMKQAQQIQEQLVALKADRDSVLRDIERVTNEGILERQRQFHALEDALAVKVRHEKAEHDDMMAEMERDRQALEKDIIDARKALEDVKQKLAAAEQARAQLATMISRAQGAIE